MIKIPVSGKNGKGKYILLDDGFEYLAQKKWWVNGGYAYRTEYVHGKDRTIHLHRLIIPRVDGLFIDHINRNRLDNRRANLRLCNPVESAQNRGVSKRNTSGYKGVSWNTARREWLSTIVVNGRFVFGGWHKDIKEAAKAYNKLSKKYAGEFAYQNKI